MSILIKTPIRKEFSELFDVQNDRFIRPAIGRLYVRLLVRKKRIPGVAFNLRLFGYTLAIGAWNIEP